MAAPDSSQIATMTRSINAAATPLLISTLVLSAGCSSQPKPTEPAPVSTRLPDYSRPLSPGQSALRLLTDVSAMPDFGNAFRDRDPALMLSLERSIAWFDKPSSKTHFPIGDVTHDRARASVTALLDLFDHAGSEQAFVGELLRMFDVYQSVGYDGNGVVLFTGYYAPVVEASLVRTSRFRVPLYTRPDDLARDDKTGTPLGRRTANGGIVPYYSRREIEESQMFRGNELVWLENELDAYIIHVNGSAKLRLPDGSPMYVGYAGKTDRPYASLGQAMIRAGLVDASGVSLTSIERTFERNPQAVIDLMYENESYVFFMRYPADNWPAGSLGFPVTPERSLATDKSVYPRAGVVLVDTQSVTFRGGSKRFLQFMLDQDTGGAIQAPGRADIFMGVGPGAEILAGSQKAEGKLYYLFLKEQFVQQWLETAGNSRMLSARR